MDFDKIREEARGLLSGAKGSHDWDHTERVLNLCMHLGKKEKADLETLKLAAVLHDIARPEQDESRGKICHARKGAELARQILQRHGLPEDRIKGVIHCIETHRFRDSRAPQSREARVLFDSDKLDSIGAVGIGRAFIFSGEMGARLHDRNIELEKTRAYSREDTAYREFLVKLRKVRSRMLTREGKRIAQGRHRFMLDFFTRLNQEVDGEL